MHVLHHKHAYINIARHKTNSLLRFLHQKHLIYFKRNFHRENVGMALLILGTLLLFLAGANYANAAGTVKPCHK